MKKVPCCAPTDRKSTRLNSSHGYISYAVFCLIRTQPRFTLVPYTTLFRSIRHAGEKDLLSLKRALSDQAFFELIDVIDGFSHRESVACDQAQLHFVAFAFAHEEGSVLRAD